MAKQYHIKLDAVLHDTLYKIQEVMARNNMAYSKNTEVSNLEDMRLNFDGKRQVLVIYPPNFMVAYSKILGLIQLFLAVKSQIPCPLFSLASGG